VEKDSEVPANLCIIEFIESYKVNLCKDYGHFQLKMTEDGLLALVLKKSLEGELKDNYLLVVNARSEHVMFLYKQIHKNMILYVIFCTKSFLSEKFLILNIVFF